MSFDEGSNPRTGFTIAKRAVAALVAAGIALCCTSPYAQERAGSPRSVERASVTKDLERQFWACDYAATVRGVSALEAGACSANYEELLRTKFGGEFAAMLEWWGKNKAAEHLALAQANPTIAGR
ncbi:MAG TPA: hypothetical protein VMN56_02665 [Casimicrobiaceae bacterium]|nr:hypothetical protein [Casimicrobiaceae bacterium]